MPLSYRSQCQAGVPLRTEGQYRFKNTLGSGRCGRRGRGAFSTRDRSQSSRAPAPPGSRCPPRVPAARLGLPLPAWGSHCPPGAPTTCPGLPLLPARVQGSALPARVQSAAKPSSAQLTRALSPKLMSLGFSKAPSLSCTGFVQSSLQPLKTRL